MATFLSNAMATVRIKSLKPLNFCMTAQFLKFQSMAFLSLLPLNTQLLLKGTAVMGCDVMAPLGSIKTWFSLPVATS